DLRVGSRLFGRDVPCRGGQSEQIEIRIMKRECRSKGAVDAGIVDNDDFAHHDRETLGQSGSNESLNAGLSTELCLPTRPLRARLPNMLSDVRALGVPFRCAKRRLPAEPLRGGCEPVPRPEERLRHWQ